MVYSRRNEDAWQTHPQSTRCKTTRDVDIIYAYAPTYAYNLLHFLFVVYINMLTNIYLLHTIKLRIHCTRFFERSRRVLGRRCIANIFSETCISNMWFETKEDLPTVFSVKFTQNYTRKFHLLLIRLLFISCSYSEEGTG